MLRRLPLFIVSAGLIVGCAPADDSDPAADEAAIREVTATEIASANAGNADAFLAVFTADAVGMPPNEPAVAGDGFRQYMSGMFEQADITIGDYTDETIIVSGDLAIHQYSFHWTVTPKDGGDAVTEEGKGLHVLRRQPDGSWKISHDIWSTDTMAEGM